MTFEQVDTVAQYRGFSESERLRRVETREKWRTGNGDPNAVLTAANGVYYWDFTNDDVYVNNSAPSPGTSWQLIGGGGGGPAALTATYVGYGSGANLLTGDANFRWDSTNSWLGVGTVPTVPLDIDGGNITTIANFTGTPLGVGGVFFDITTNGVAADGNVSFRMINDSGSTTQFFSARSGLPVIADSFILRQATGNELYFETPTNVSHMSIRGTSGQVKIGDARTLATAQCHIHSQSAGRVALVVEGDNGQASNVFEVHDDAGNIHNIINIPAVTSPVTVFNEQGGDLDFRIEGTTRTNLFFVDAGNNRVGVSTGTPDRLFHAESNDAVTAAVTYTKRASHTTSGVAAALFGVGEEHELEDAGGSMQVASEQVTLWADATAGSESPLLRFTTYPAGSAGPGYCGFWTWDGVDGTTRTVIPGGTGDVTCILRVMYTVCESGGGTAAGEITATPGGGAVTLYTDGVDTFTLTVAAGGAVTVVRSAGAATASIALWLVWI